jgi:hypothetical protein
MKAILLLLVAFSLSACDDGGDPLRIPDAGPDASVPDATPPVPPPDLRLKLVGADDEFVMGCAFGGAACTINLSTFDGAAGNSFGTTGGEFMYLPLTLDAANDPSPSTGDYNWWVTMSSPSYRIEELVGTARTGETILLDDQIAEELRQHLVITSLDIKPVVYGLTANATKSGTPAYTTPGAVDLVRADLDAWVAAEGSAGRVVTALSAYGEAIRAYSFARENDATTFEASVVDATTATVFEAAGTLAASGYIISAFGQVGADAYVLVGTRVSGATAARELYTHTGDRLGDEVGDTLALGYAIVATIYDRGSIHVIAER